MIMGAYIKILINYSQTIAILNNLHLNWGQTLSEMFIIQKVASGGLQQVIALECVLKGEIMLLFVFLFLLFL